MLPDGAGRGRAGAADSPQPRAEQCARAQQGRRVTSLLGRVRLEKRAWPARLGWDVRWHRRGKVAPDTGYVTGMQTSPSAPFLVETSCPKVEPTREPPKGAQP